MGQIGSRVIEKSLIFFRQSSPLAVHVSRRALAASASLPFPFLLFNHSSATTSPGDDPIKLFYSLSLAVQTNRLERGARKQAGEKLTGGLTWLNLS